MNRLIENTEKVVANHFGISVEDMVQGGKARKITDARHFLWYILYYVYGFKISFITQRYGITRRNFFYFVTAIKEGAKYQQFYHRHLATLLNELKSVDLTF